MLLDDQKHGLCERFISEYRVVSCLYVNNIIDLDS